MSLTTVQSGASIRIKGTIQDDNGVAIEPTTLVFTLYMIDGETRTIINSHNNTTLAPATDAPGGALSHLLGAASTALADSTNNDSETHRIRYKWTYAGGGVGIDYVTYEVVKDEAPT